MANRKILLLDIGAPYGGVEAYIENLVELLAGRAEFFCVCALPELAKRLRAHGAHVVCIPVLATRWSKIIRFLAAAFVVPYIILRHHVDVVQMNGFLESALLLPVRMLGCSAIRIAHGPSEIDRYRWYKRPEMFFPRLASLLSLRFASKVVCVSQAVRDDVKKFVPETRIYVVPNWIPRMPLHNSARKTLQSPIQLLYLGRLVKYKGAHLLIEAVRDIPGVHITMVGSGSFQKDLEALAQGLDITFQGFHTDTSKFYNTTDIFVNPSLGPEGLPIVSLESMAYGLPCIFSDLAVHTEITNHGEGALLFRSGSAASLREKIQLFISDPERRQSCSIAAKSLIAERYSPHAALTGYLKAFDLQPVDK